MARRIQLRRDTAANWTSTNPALAQGEIGIDLTSSKIKIGNGSTLWNALSYWDDAEINISAFGEGFSLTTANKIVTNKLYSTTQTQPTQNYRLELDTNGVVKLPDGSIINGSTIRGVAGTGELNYTGITIGPSTNDAEKTWMWVDHANAYISTNNFANTWTFGNDGILTLPAAGDINIPNGRANVTGTANTVGGGATVGVRSILAIDSAFGSNDVNAPASAQAIRGRVTGSNLTKTCNYVAGVTGQYLVTGTNASEFINTGLLGVVGDQTTTANAAVVAYLDGDGGLTTAGSAYGVSMKNSTPGSGFDYGLDLQFIDLNVAGTTAPFKQADIRFSNGALQRDTGTVSCPGNASTVVYTASGQGQHTIRLLIQVEGNEGAPEGWDTQACEMIIAKSFRTDDVAATVYAVVHTSTAPLATFTAQWNALTSRVEVLCATPSANSVYVRTFATEITTSD